MPGFSIPESNWEIICFIKCQKSSMDASSLYSVLKYTLAKEISHETGAR